MARLIKSYKGHLTTRNNFFYSLTRSIVSQQIAGSDIATGLLHLGYLRGRVLSVAAAKFATQMAQVLSDRYQPV